MTQLSAWELAGMVARIRGGHPLKGIFVRNLPLQGGCEIWERRYLYDWTFSGDWSIIRMPCDIATPG